LKVLAGWIYLIWQRIGMARNIDARHSTRDANFTATNRLRPNTVPFLARLARRFL
jgi:hypothetical protein